MKRVFCSRVGGDLRCRIYFQPCPWRLWQTRSKLQLLAQAGERGGKIAQLLLRGGEYIHFRHRQIPLTQTT